jgi:integrase
VNGKRTLRQSLDTRDLARARKNAAALEDLDAPVLKPIGDALKSFMDQCAHLAVSTRGKYQNALDYFKRYCDSRHEDNVTGMTTEFLDGYRTSRTLSAVTWRREMQTLRQFFGFCHDRGWIRQNITKPIKNPRNIKPNEIEPYTANEIAKMLAACDKFGRGPYERSRAKAIVLLLRYTALRIGDIAMLTRDRISWDGNRWRIFLRTEKSGAPVFLPLPDVVKQAVDALPVPRGAGEDPKHLFWNGLTSKRALMGITERTLAAVFKESGVVAPRAHRFRHTLATELLGRGASFEDVADILGNSPTIVRKHYAKWSPARQRRIDELMDAMIGPPAPVPVKSARTN